MSDKNIVEILLDENDFSNVTLYGDDGEEMEFEQVDTISLDDELFCILHPIAPDIPEEAVIVFVVMMDENDEPYLSIVEDDALAQRVIDEYDRLWDEEDQG